LGLPALHFVFPKLIAGSPTRYREIADQITDRFKANHLDDFLSGFIRFYLGLAKIFGFNFPENFNSPYTSIALSIFGDSGTSP